MKKKILITLFVCTGILSNAQQKIEADRPSNAVSVNIADKNQFITEIGFEREVEEDELSFLLPRTYFRFGLGKSIELRLNSELTIKREVEGQQFERGLKPVYVGTKIGLSKGAGWKPSASVLFSTDIPNLSSSQLRNIHWAPKIRVLFNNELNDKISLDYNFGTEWNGTDVFPAWIYATNVEYGLSDKTELYCELYGNIKKENLPSHNAGAGFSYYPSQSFKLDAGLSKDLVNPEAWFAALGISFVIK